MFVFAFPPIVPAAKGGAQLRAFRPFMVISLSTGMGKSQPFGRL
jgi:hypothetical protein